MTKREFSKYKTELMRVINPYLLDSRLCIMLHSNHFKHQGETCYTFTVRVYANSGTSLVKKLHECEIANYYTHSKNWNAINDLACALHDYTGK